MRVKEGRQGGRKDRDVSVGEELDFEVWMRKREREGEKKKVPVKLVADSAAARLEVAQGLTLNPGHSPSALPTFFFFLLAYFAQAYTVPVEMQITSSSNMYDHTHLRNPAVCDLYPNRGTKQDILNGPRSQSSTAPRLFFSFFWLSLRKGRVLMSLLTEILS